MNCIVLSDDLMFGSLIASGLANSAWQTRSASSLSQAIERAKDSQAVAVVVDLNMPVKADEIVATFSAQNVRVLGVASHVHAGKIKAARDAGFEKVLTRSQVADTLLPSLEGPDDQQ